MHCNSSPGRINVEKTSEQFFQPPLPLENQKAVERETENSSTKLDSRQVDGGIE